MNAYKLTDEEKSIIARIESDIEVYSVSRGYSYGFLRIPKEDYEFIKVIYYLILRHYMQIANDKESNDSRVITTIAPYIRINHYLAVIKQRGV